MLGYGAGGYHEWKQEDRCYFPSSYITGLENKRRGAKSKAWPQTDFRVLSFVYNTHAGLLNSHPQGRGTDSAKESKDGLGST